MNYAENFITYMADGANVARYHTKRVIKMQTVGHHAARVAQLCWYLSDGKPSVTLLMAALDHDNPEFVTGDTPAYAKRRLAAEGVDFDALENTVRDDYRATNFERQLAPEELCILKQADRLEGMLYCLEEVEMGNSTLYKTYYAYVRLLAELPATPRCSELVRAIGDRFDACK